MKLLFDQNLSPYLVKFLSDIHPGSIHVRDIGLDSSLDTEIINYAAKNNLIIITRDIDFSELSVFVHPSPKIVWIRIGNCSTEKIENILRKHFANIEKLYNGELPPVLALI